VKVMELATLKGVFTDIAEELTVSYVNAPLFAQERGVEVHLTTSQDSPRYRNLVTVRGTLATGEVVSVSGTLSGARRMVEKIVAVDGYEVDVELAPHLAFFRYTDRPGVIGQLGQILGAAGVNVAGMQVARDEKGGQALITLSVDSAIPAETLQEIAEAIDADWARSADIS
jgi:D-3-phosphoglycerate dehydrogenase